MSRELFGTDGIRGVAGEEPLTPEGAEQIGRAIGVYFGEGDGGVFSIGGDTRESTEWLVEAVARGVIATGLDIENLGVLPTPALAYITRETEARAGIMITASHNPFGDNGIKVFDKDGGKLPDNTESRLNWLINSTIPAIGAGRRYDGSNRIHRYVDHIVDAVDADLGGAKVVLDLANGAASRVVDGTEQSVAENIFSRLGAVVLPLFDHPNGRNINDGCGATDTEELQHAVADNGWEMGFAFDGDTDRVIAVDAEGRALTGDHLLYLLALSLQQEGIAVTPMSNMGLELALKKAGIDVYRTEGVGDRYVLETMKTYGLGLGGEQSGHIIVANHMPTGDGLLAAGLTAKYAIESGQSLAEWRDLLSLLPQELVNVQIPSRAVLEAALADSEVRGLIAQHTEQLTGVGRVFVRKSGTEPKARVMVEADNAKERAEAIAEQIRQVAGRLMLIS